MVTRPDELVLNRAGDGTVFAHTSRELLLRKPGEPGWRPLRIDSPLARGYSQVSLEPDGSVSVVGWNALLRYDPGVAVAPPAALTTRLYRVRSHQADGNSVLVDRSEPSRVALAPQRSLEVEFGVNTAETGLEFRSQLEGLDPHFGDWSALSRRDFAALPPGDYTLVVEARTGSGRGAEPLRWSFQVLPRWYQTGLARAGAVLLGLLLIALVARQYVIRRLELIKQRNRELELLVSERTADLARANRQLARLATLDGLTGISNRRAFDNYLENAWLQAQQSGAPVSLLMMDVDHFKGYNDAHGHLAGDDMLRRIAGELARAAQGEHEQLARYGGEEFALVLAGADAKEARARAESICSRFRQHLTGGLTISIGVATRQPRHGGSARELIDAADQALYQAKHNGRARVEMAA
jgi:diguanylate cyclase (GGDEF)-like protein